MPGWVDLPHGRRGPAGADASQLPTAGERDLNVLTPVLDLLVAARLPRPDRRVPYRSTGAFVATSLVTVN